MPCFSKRRNDQFQKICGCNRDVRRRRPATLLAALPAASDSDSDLRSPIPIPIPIPISDSDSDSDSDSELLVQIPSPVADSGVQAVYVL